MGGSSNPRDVTQASGNGCSTYVHYMQLMYEKVAATVWSNYITAPYTLYNYHSPLVTTNLCLFCLYFGNV